MLDRSEAVELALQIIGFHNFFAERTGAQPIATGKTSTATAVEPPRFDGTVIKIEARRRGGPFSGQCVCLWINSATRTARSSRTASFVSPVARTKRAMASS